MWRNRNPFSLFAEMYNGTATMESNMEGAKNYDFQLYDFQLYDSSTSLLSIYPKELKTESQKDICTHVVIIHSKQKVVPKCPSVDE